MPVLLLLVFLTRFSPLVRGILSGWDRLFLTGNLRALSYQVGLQKYLWAHRIPYKDFHDRSLKVTQRVIQASLAQAQQLGREIRYLNSSDVRKEDVAREIAARDHIRSGLICVLQSVDPCMSFQINKNRDRGKLEIRYRQRKCLHLYHYQIHPVFGFMHARLQTWFPFRIYVCINGREWLARQMDQAGLRYQRRDNTFTWLEDLEQTQALFDQQLQADWTGLLSGLAQGLNPVHDEIFAKYHCQYYWSVKDSEWASDVMFPSPAALAEVYPRLVRYAVTAFDTVDVLRFLGQRVPLDGKVPHRCRHEVSSSLKHRLQGTRLKHWVNHNSVKLYDKASVLRAECTLRQTEDFKVYRTAEGDPQGAKEWRPLRCGIADLPRRAEVSQAANDRYLEALAAVHDRTPLRQLVEPLCQPTPEPLRRQRGASAAAAGNHREQQAALSPTEAAAAVSSATQQPELPPAAPQTTAAPKHLVSQQPGSRSVSVVAAATGATPQPELATPQPVATAEGGQAAATGGGDQADHPAPAKSGTAEKRRRRVRALNPLAAEDAALLAAVSRHEFLLNGLRNRDLRRLLFGQEKAAPAEERRRCALVTRKLRLLRGHGLLHKGPKTHRYVVSERGRLAITALLAARNASVEELTRCAG